MKTIMRTEQDVINVFNGRRVGLQVRFNPGLSGSTAVVETDKEVYNELCSVMEQLGFGVVPHSELNRTDDGSIYRLVSVYNKVSKRFVTAEYDKNSTMSKLVDAKMIISCYQEFLDYHFLDYQECLKCQRVEVKDMSIEDQKKAVDKLSRALELVEEVFGEQCSCKIHLLLEKDKKCYPMYPLTALKRGYIQGDTNIDRSIWWAMDGTILMFVRGVGSFVVELSKNVL